MSASTKTGREVVSGVIKFILKKFGIGISSYSELARLKKWDSESKDLQFCKFFPESELTKILALCQKSKSQLRQDVFVLICLDFKQQGYFVEFGATNGVDLSNSYLLEHEFDWKGILAEPGRIWQDELRLNRPNAHIEDSCVWIDSKTKIHFNETEMPELSTIEKFSKKDGHRKSRKEGTLYEVETISLIDLLYKYKAPKYIDYMSIDTEGSEFEILKDFNFDEYNFGVITCEHNYTSDRERIFQLLTSKGYERRFENLSQFDDWYINTKIY